MDEQKKIALVTGASQGMGATHAILLAKAGWRVCLADVKNSDDILLKIADEGGSATSFYLDVADSENWISLTAEIESNFGKLHGLVNNAGISYRSGIMETSDEDWRKIMEINLSGVFYGMRAVAPLMHKSGGGSIVNISSIAGQLGYHGAAYGASKWGVRGLTKSAAAEFAPWNIRVNSIQPGLIETPMVSDALPFITSSLKSIPLSRPGRPEEVSAAIVFLLSEEASYISGSELNVDGALIAGGTYWRVKNDIMEMMNP